MSFRWSNCNVNVHEIESLIPLLFFVKVIYDFLLITKLIIYGKSVDLGILIEEWEIMI